MKDDRVKSGPRRTWTVTVPLVVLLIAGVPAGASDYYSSATITERLAWLAQNEPNLVRTQELAVSRDKRTI